MGTRFFPGFERDCNYRLISLDLKEGSECLDFYRMSELRSLAPVEHEVRVFESAR